MQQLQEQDYFSVKHKSFPVKMEKKIPKKAYTEQEKQSRPQAVQPSRDNVLKPKATTKKVNQEIELY